MASGIIEWFSDASDDRFIVSDEASRADLRCGCGYGIVAGTPLPACPMCGASAWEERARDARRPPRGPRRPPMPTNDSRTRLGRGRTREEQRPKKLRQPTSSRGASRCASSPNRRKGR